MSATPNADAGLAPRLLTAAEVAEVLGVTERYVWRLSREGQLPRVKFGRYVRFAAEDLDTFIAKHRESGAVVRRGRVEQSEPSGKSPSSPRRRF